MELQIDAKEMEANADRAAAFLKSIANGVRLRLLCKLLDNELSAGELSQELGITQANLSQHLAWLKKQDLLSSRREGTVIHYRLSDSRVEPLMRVLYSMFCEPLRP
jgi:DNA-binding transcriptional ArsR family regulator